MKRKLSVEMIENMRQEIYDTLVDPTSTHEQRVTYLARKAENMLTVLDEPEELDELLRCDIESRCICNLFEGDAPYRPRYICVDFPKFLKQGSEFLQLGPATNFAEALTNLMILYRNIPSITNYTVYIGDLDDLLDPFIKDMTDEEVKFQLKLWLTMIDRTILDSFCHADIGPKATRFGYLLMEVEAELQNAVPNLTMLVSDETEDEFLLAGVKCALKSAKPSFANDRMFRSELGDDYCVASCYNGLYKGGGSYTLSRLILSNIAKKAKDINDFKTNVLPHVMDVMARYMDERIRFLVEESGWFESSFLVKEGLVSRDKFTAMFGMVGLAECVNNLLAKEGCNERFGHSEKADALGVEIMELIDELNNKHVNKYCSCTGNHFLLHAQVGIDSDHDCSPGTRIPIGEEPDELIDHLTNINKFQKYFPSGTGDIFPIDLTVHKNPEYVLDIIKGSMSKDIRYLSFYASDSDVIRVTGYLVKKSEMEKLESGENVRQNTTGLGLGAKKNCKILDRRVR
ncbi:MAG: YjjI family glycine radical enzyme [Lachnospiraceae bacterium]|nr:YjjI family glycine radical enzyme [Lachnospiraceae bacterium]